MKKTTMKHLWFLCFLLAGVIIAIVSIGIKVVTGGNERILSETVSALAQGPNRNGLYVLPENNFILDPAESPVALELGSLHLSEVQRQLDQARADNPDTPIVLTLTGIYE